MHWLLKLFIALILAGVLAFLGLLLGLYLNIPWAERVIDWLINRLGTINAG